MPIKPRQPRLFSFAAPPAASRQRVTHDQRNQNVAKIILADPEAYGGEEALPVIWARAITSAPEGHKGN